MALTKKLTGAVAAIAFVLTAVLTLAFKAEDHSERKAGKKLTTYYLQYGGTNSEAAYESSSNWSNITDEEPESDPCPGDNNVVCVLKADFATTPTASDIATYLSGLTPSGSGATTYCTNNANIFSKKP